jgi:hypothetical protein
MPNTTIEPDNIVTPVHTREGDPQFITSDTARGGPRVRGIGDAAWRICPDR